MSEQLFLASRSPRRRELLRQVGLAHRLLDVEVDETPIAGEAPADYVMRVARAKAAAGLSRRDAVLPVLAADTSVVIDDAILGKPLDRAHGLEMLRRLSGRWHAVMTAVCVADDQRQEQVLVSSRVQFRAISEPELEAYWRSGEPLDKAGAYAIQGLGAVFVSAVEGSYSGIVGLPLFETVQLLEGFRVSCWRPHE